MIPQLPLRDFGLQNIPAVPYLLTFSEPLLTLFRLARRALEVQPAKDGLSNRYTIGAQTGTAYEFLFGSSAAQDLARATNDLEEILVKGFEGVRDAALRRSVSASRVSSATQGPLWTGLSLEKPEDFSISWTNFENIYQNAQSLLPGWANTLASLDEADQRFWPTIANYGIAYNLIVLQLVTSAKAAALKPLFGDMWSFGGLDTMQSEGRLYAIDLSIFGEFGPVTVDGWTRFTPATITLLEQNAATKALKPLAVHVANGSQSQLYSRTRTPDAWLYALQAAKASLTVYGIWLGHVYHWHIVTAALQMTMFNTLSADHPILQLASSQSNYLIAFNEVLLLLWDYIAPPTSIATPFQFLELCDGFANGRRFFDDDPKSALAQLGLEQAAFTRNEPWDLYPLVRNLLRIWDSTQTFVDIFVEKTYSDDQAVDLDTQLQAWMTASADPNQGNIRGLPAMNTKAALKAVLASFLYRMTAHGISRLNNSANPALTFIANFPPCLQKSDLPTAQADLDVKSLLGYLPKTGTIGKMVTFYFTFVFSVPYTSFIPPTGVESDLFFPSGLGDPRNVALVARRKDLISFIENVYQPEQPQIYQWPMCIET
ncbi:MAG: lipoxygenase family protein [Bryobacteraceae bacterium]